MWKSAPVLLNSRMRPCKALDCIGLSAGCSPPLHSLSTVALKAGRPRTNGSQRELAKHLQGVDGKHVVEVSLAATSEENEEALPERPKASTRLEGRQGDFVSGYLLCLQHLGSGERMGLRWRGVGSDPGGAR